jgi:hypothetical protein
VDSAGLKYFISAKACIVMKKSLIENAIKTVFNRLSVFPSIWNLWICEYQRLFVDLDYFVGVMYFTFPYQCSYFVIIAFFIGQWGIFGVVPNF